MQLQKRLVSIVELLGACCLNVVVSLGCLEDNDMGQGCVFSI